MFSLLNENYGFTTTTPALWFKDLFKSTVISTVFAVVAVSTGLLIVQRDPNLWWLYLWFLFLFFSLFLMYLSPYIIEPLFNKFEPLNRKELEEEIWELTSRAGISVKKIFKMDASGRSRHTNAYFSGIGRVKRIVLYDTLLEKMSNDEILAVLGHEAGHWKKRHVFKMIVFTEIASLATIYASFNLLKNDALTNMFAIAPSSFFAKIVILIFLGQTLFFFMTPAINFFSRRFEKESDAFAIEITGNREAMRNVLIKLSKDNLSNLYPHPLYAAFYYSHPPVIERIREIDNHPL